MLTARSAATCGARTNTPDNLRSFHHANGYGLASRQAKRHVTADRTSIATFEHTFDPRNRKV